MESNEDSSSSSSRHLNTGMEIEVEDQYSTPPPQTTTSTTNRLSIPPAAASLSVLPNLHTPSPPPPQPAIRQYQPLSINSEYDDISDNIINIDNVDPDNMTYDELIQLGQRLGDVATEQWKAKCKPIINVYLYVFIFTYRVYHFING